ncbi:MAG: N-acetylneuraminate synthase family protein [Gammaproteobacteria bacterium]|nr:N-acetylneuraminate synthase family protein [Gammaproteobacteria bacterium]
MSTSWYDEVLQNQKTYVIAEIGSNFGGDLSLARDYVHACAKSGADAVKFQSWNTSTLQNGIDQKTGQPSAAIPVLQKYELPIEWHVQLKQECDTVGVDFLSTPFDLDRADLLNEIGCRAIKIASGDLTYTQLLRRVGRMGLPVILSTGMSDYAEIEAALDALGDARKNTILLHCVGAYPPDISDANLRAIPNMANFFNLPIGFSDHYPGDATAIGAVALGARVIEKHVTFSRDAGHPDSPFAMEMNEFSQMIARIREIESALGNGEKRCMRTEQGGRIGGRRSLYWRRSMEEGCSVSELDMAALRPAEGQFEPRHMESLVGKKLVRPVLAGQLVNYADFVNE